MLYTALYTLYAISPVYIVYSCSDHPLLQVEPFVIGVCGGSASGKTTVANKIISELGVPWVTLLSMDSFYKVLNEKQHEQAAINEVNKAHRSLVL